MDEFNYKPLCDYCEMKLDMSGGKRGNDAKHFLCNVVV